MIICSNGAFDTEAIHVLPGLTFYSLYCGISFGTEKGRPYRRGGLTIKVTVNRGSTVHADLPTFYEKKVEDLPPFGKKTRKEFLCSENIAIFSLPMTQNEPIFPISTSPNRREITKLVLNNNNFIHVCSLFAMTSKVRKKWKNFKINFKGCRFSKKNSLKVKAEDLPLYRKTWQVCTCCTQILTWFPQKCPSWFVDVSLPS